MPTEMSDARIHSADGGSRTDPVRLPRASRCWPVDAARPSWQPDWPESFDLRSTNARSVPFVAAINQPLAERYFPQGAVIGKNIWIPGREQPPAEIVRVVTNGGTDDLTHLPEPEIYLAFWEATAFSKHLVLRTAGDPRSVRFSQRFAERCWRVGSRLAARQRSTPSKHCDNE